MRCTTTCSTLAASLNSILFCVSVVILNNPLSDMAAKLLTVSVIINLFLLSLVGILPWQPKFYKQLYLQIAILSLWKCSRDRERNIRTKYPKEVRYSYSVYRCAHLFVIAISSTSHIKRKQPHMIFLEYRCSVTMINIVKNTSKGKFIN